MTGRILLDGRDLGDFDDGSIRTRFGWVSSVPNPFAWSVRNNIVCAPSLHGRVHGRCEAEALTRSCLERVGLWEALKDSLDLPGSSLCPARQQILCIARALSTGPDVLLMDEPTATIDGSAEAGVEALIRDLGRDLTIVVASQDAAQAARLSNTVFELPAGPAIAQNA